MGNKEGEGQRSFSDSPSLSQGLFDLCLRDVRKSVGREIQSAREVERSEVRKT